jgi:quercetin dioxygenase-like cupin family protein
MDLPRPTFDGPSLIPYKSTKRHVWGDRTSGEVTDAVYVSSAKIHQIVFALSPGGIFRHSDEHRTIFGADEVYHVLSGTLVLNNPETGEVHRVLPGEAVFFRRDTWHHGFSYGTDRVRVLEFFAPPPSQGTSSAYAKTKPNLAVPKYTDDRWLGRWPKAKVEAMGQQTMNVLRDSDICWRLEGKQNQVLVGILVSTEHLTSGKIVLLPGQQSDFRKHKGDQGLYLMNGSVGVRVPSPGAEPWFELEPGDGFYLPEGTSYGLLNNSNEPAVVLFGTAPAYIS